MEGGVILVVSVGGGCTEARGVPRGRDRLEEANAIVWLRIGKSSVAL